MTPLRAPTWLRRLSAEALLCVAGLLASSGPAAAQVYQLTFSGSVDTMGKSLSGNTGSAVPVILSVNYDFLQGSNSPTLVFSSGTATSGGTTQTEWYRYVNSGLVSSSLQIGSSTFTPTFSDRIPVAGIPGSQLWLNTNLSSAAPTAYWMFGNTSTPSNSSNLTISVGGASSSGSSGTLTMQSGLVIEDLNDIFAVNLTSVTVSSVPEPATAGLIPGLAGIGFVAWSRRRRV